MCDIEGDQYYEIEEIIETDLKANIDILPKEHVDAIRHYLDYGQLQMAFEFLYSEIMERKNAICTISHQELYELAKTFKLQDMENCVVNGLFWDDVNNYINGRKLNR